MKMIKIEIACLVAFIICVFMSSYNLDRECEGIRQGILRLHVVAASDSEKDQQVKLQLRDELLLKGKEIFSDSTTKQEAEEKLEKGMSLMQKEADTFLKKIGYSHKAEVSLGKSYFPTRKYENFTLPAGYYDALKVVIGEGKGQNWWCVMFPALCLPAAQRDENAFDGVLTEKQQKIVSGERYEVRLWIVEKWQELSKNFIYNN